jgi:hypothetical protein
MADVGYIELGAGINELIGSLVLGTSTFTSGTFGATGSGAQNIMDEYFAGTGIITVSSAGLAGDYNADGVVDTADYVAWRKDPGSFGGDPDGYDAWRTNFGAMQGPGSGSSASNPAVPEPSTWLLAGLAILSVVLPRRKNGTFWDILIS